MQKIDALRYIPIESMAISRCNMVIILTIFYTT